MRCPTCQHENRDGARFCEACGSQLELLCPMCGNPSRPGAAFCDSCGTSLKGQTSAPPPQPPLSYTPRHLAEKILTSRAALEGERKPVTVLFCDLANSTALAERLGPEAMHTLLNQFFELALAEVHRYEGTINQFLGDGFMALFGAPLAVEDHARRALLAALGIQQGMHELRADVAPPIFADVEHARQVAEPREIALDLARGVALSARRQAHHHQSQLVVVRA